MLRSMKHESWSGFVGVRGVIVKTQPNIAGDAFILKRSVRKGPHVLCRVDEEGGRSRPEIVFIGYLKF